ncbi:uncharacterized protein LOC135461430 [Liolophura sinensis]|uniref:uncharacterized protein LOC135461430 n=1 Tax=Liolophura sinensis TaxID=3198878 RepID=UPI0031590BEF
MFLAPSHIHFTDCTGLLALHEITPEESFIEISRKIVQKGDCPKLQVVEKAGNFFTLNNTQLHVFRRLEAQGKCPRVRVDKVPLSEIPEGILRMMVIPVKNNNSDDNTVILKSPADTSRKTTKGYHKLGQMETDQGGNSDSEHESDSETEDSAQQESESDFDWTDEDDRDCSGHGSSDEGPSDEEKESLL